METTVKTRQYQEVTIKAAKTPMRSPVEYSAGLCGTIKVEYRPWRIEGYEGSLNANYPKVVFFGCQGLDLEALRAMKHQLNGINLPTTTYIVAKDKQTSRVEFLAEQQDFYISQASKAYFKTDYKLVTSAKKGPFLGTPDHRAFKGYRLHLTDEKLLEAVNYYLEILEEVNRWLEILNTPTEFSNDTSKIPTNTPCPVESELHS